MRLHEEPDSIVQTVAAQAGSDVEVVRSIIADLHHVVDRLVADDVTVLMSPLFFRRSGEPVFDAIIERFATADWQDAFGLKTLEPVALARELGIEHEQLDLYPVVFAIHVLADLLDWRGIEWDSDEATVCEDVFRAWRRTFEREDKVIPRYRVSHVGLERDFEAWLMQNLDVLAAAGYPVEDVKQQKRLGSAGIPDLVCRIAKDTIFLRAGDWLVIENKATPVGLAALDQLRRYVDGVEATLASAGESVYGLLIADGITVALQRALFDEGFGYLSLAGLGYRDHLYRQHRLGHEPDSDESTVEPVAPELAAVPEERPYRASTDAASEGWLINGIRYMDRKAANRALARSLGTYTAAQWKEAQRRVGLRP